MFKSLTIFLWSLLFLFCLSWQHAEAQNEPDLTINTARSIYTVTAGESVDITFVAGNFGSADATDPFKIQASIGGQLNVILGEFIIEDDIPLFNTIDVVRTINIPANFPADTYDLLSIISDVDGERDNANGNFALTKIIVRPGSGGTVLPDLTASNLVVRPESDISLRYDITYSNLGDGFSEFAFGNIYVSDDATLSDDDDKVFPITTPGLNAGSSFNQLDGRFTFQDFDFTGEKYIIFSINEGDNNGEGIREESDITNNTISVLYNFDGIVNDDKDLALSDFSININEDGTARPGQEVTATYTVTALEGATPATTITTELLGRFLSTETIILLEDNIPALAAGASVALTSTFTIPDDTDLAEYTLRTIINPNGTIEETARNNNSNFTPLFVTYPDLEIVDISCPVEYPSRTPGSQLTYDLTLRNNGTVATLPTTIYLYQARTGRGRSTDDQLASVDIPAIPAGQSIATTVVATFANGVNFPPFRSNNGEVGYGNFYFSLTEFVLIFSNTQPFRLSDTFDIFCQKTNTDVEIALSADVLTFGVDLKVQYTVTVTNNGSEVANNVQTNIGFREAPRGRIIGTPSLSKGILYEPGGGFPSKQGWFIESLAPGESATADVNYELFIQDNTDPTVEVYELSFLALPSIEDSEVGNNTASLTFTEGASSGICALDFDFNEFTNLNQVVPGSTVSFDLKFTNLSPEPLAASTFGLYIERTENGEVVGRKSASALADLPAFGPNESKDLIIELTLNDPLRFEPGSTEFNLGRFFLAANANDNDELCTFNYNFISIDYPDANLVLEETNSEGCFGTDNTVAADLKITNQGTNDIATAIVVFLGGAQVNPNTPGVVFSDNDVTDDFPPSAYWVIDGGLGVGESTTLRRPFLSPDGETVRAFPRVSRDFSALDNEQGNLSLTYTFDADCSLTPAPCSGDITLSTQAEVEAFGPCEIYDGSITIAGNSIVSLETLRGLKKINGTLTIENTILLDFDGLNDLEEVNALVIRENTNLNTLIDLSALTQSPEAITIVNNDNLPSLLGIRNIVGTGTINIVNNEKLTTLSGIAGITITRTIIITDNPNLTNLEAFTNTQSLNTLLLINNPKLSSISEFSNLIGIGSAIQIINSGIEDLTGLESLRSVQGDLTIVNNTRLKNLDALINLEEVNDVVLVNNDALSDCCGLYPVLSDDSQTVNTEISNNDNGCNSLQDIIDNCDNTMPTCTFSETGILRDLTGLLAGCGFVIELPTGSSLEPIGFPSTFTPRDGQQVRFTSMRVDNVVSNCQIGPIVDIICIENIITSGEIDLELTLTPNKPGVGVYESSKFTLTIENKGAQAAQDVVIDFSNENIVLANGEQPVASQGSFDFFADQIWNVGTLAAGASATLNVNYFFLTEPFLYAEVSEATGIDGDSTPGNGNGQSANEDDEVVFPAGITPTCDLNVVVNSINCELPFVTYSITVTGASTNKGIGIFVPQDEFGNDVFQALEPNTPQTIRAYFGDGIAPIVRTYGVFAGDNPPTSCRAQFDITCDAGTQLPDLNLANLEVVPQDDGFTAGEVVEYFVDVANIGQVTATGDYTIGAFLSTDDQLDDNDPQVGVIPTGNTPVGTIADVPGAITVPNSTADGDYYLILQTDRDNDIVESREDNNVISIPIRIGDKSCICTDEYAPVCGSDGITYGNACEAECAGITEYTIGECSTGDGIDLELSLGTANPNVGVYQNTLFTLTLRNTGVEAASNVKVSLPLEAGKVVLSGGTTPDASQGSYKAFTTQIWDVGTLGAGQSATLTIDLFFLAKPFLFAEVIEATGNDADSTPNNGDGITANEDDEAVFGGTIGNNCRIVVSIFGKRCNDNGTPDNPDDDTYTFTIKPTATNGSDQFVIISPINTEVPVDYGTELDLGPFAISDGSLKVIVIDSDNASCQTEVTVQPPTTCSNGGGGGGNAVVLTIDAPATYSQYTTVPIKYTVTNNSTTANARNIIVKTPQPAGTTNSSSEVTQGDFDLFREQWIVGNLAPGASATLTWNIFAVTGDGIAGEGSIEGDDVVVPFIIGKGSLTGSHVGRLSTPIIDKVQLYPTLTTGAATITFVTDSEMTLEMAIYTLQGQRVLVDKVQTVKGLNQQVLDVTNLATGTYFVKIGDYRTLRLVKM